MSSASSGSGSAAISDIAAQYEVLRGAALGHVLPPEARSGLALFLRRGMWGWARALAPVAPVVAEMGEFLRAEIVAGRRYLPAGANVLRAFTQPFDQVRVLMKQMAKMSIWERIKMVTGLGQMGAFQPGANMIKQKGHTGHRKSPKERAKERKNKKKKS